MSLATTLLNAVTVAGAGTALSCSGASKVIMTVTTSSNFIGEVVFEGSIDAGTSYFPMIGNLPGTKTPVDRLTGATPIGTTVEFEVDGFDFIRPNVKSISAGTVTAVAVATARNTAGRAVIYKPISAAAAGANAVWTPAAGKKFRLMGFHLSFSGTANAKWQDGATDITGLYYGVANTAINGGLPEANGYLSAAADNALNLNLSAAVAVGGLVWGTEE